MFGITTENRSGSAADAAAKEQRTEMPLSDLHPFEGHPFKVLDDELMEQTVESIKQIGVVSPLIVRPDSEGGYEILSGHRRLHAAQLAGLETVPVIVKEMDDDAAIIFMVDSNLQRENILPSERAFSYKMKLEAMKHQGQRGDGGKCILQLRGVRPFKSDKYDLTQHPNYKLTAGADKKNTFSIEAFLDHRLKLKPGDKYEVVDADHAK